MEPKHTPEPTSDPARNREAAQVGYALIRQLGFALDELSSQGLELRYDERGHWRWRWPAHGLVGERGFWALGEAIVDAVVTRYPALFDTQGAEAV